MPRIVKTTDPFPADILGQLALYSGMDNLTLFEIDAELDKLLTPGKRELFNFELELQAPLLEMALNGVLVDESMRRRMTRTYEAELKEVQRRLHLYCEAIGYYDYYLDQALIQFRLDADLEPTVPLPRSWENWTALPIQLRKSLKARNPKACAEYHKSLKAFGPPYDIGAEKTGAFNGNSSDQKLRLFYDFFGHAGNTVSQKLSPNFAPPWNQTRGISEIRTLAQNKEYTPSADRECLEKIQSRGLDCDHRDAHFWALPFLSCSSGQQH